MQEVFLQKKCLQITLCGGQDFKSYEVQNKAGKTGNYPWGSSTPSGSSSHSFRPRFCLNLACSNVNGGKSS